MSITRLRRRATFAAIALAVIAGGVQAGSPSSPADCVEPGPGETEGATIEQHLVCLNQHDHYFDAITYGEAAVRGGKESPDILSEIGYAYTAVQDSERGQGYLERAVALKPDDPKISARLANVLYGRILRVSPDERRARAANGFERCNPATSLSDDEAARLVGEYASKAEELLGVAIARFDDPMALYNARSALAMLHITTRGEQAIPELAILVNEVNARASTDGNTQLSDFAAMLMLNLSTAYRAHGDEAEAVSVAERALATAKSPSVQRLVRSGTANVRGDEGVIDMDEVVGNQSPCEKIFDLNAAH